MNGIDPKLTAGPASLQRSGGGPLWRQLVEDLRRRLDSDAFSDGFPGEMALVDEYGLSRQTVRHALKVLRDEGRVVASRGRPPRQAAPAELAQRLGTLYSLHESVRSLGLDQRSVVHTLDVRADGVYAHRLGLEESTPLVYLERLRFAGDEPLAIDQVWLPHDLAAPLLEADFSTTALYERYSTLCGVTVTGGAERIQAVIPTPHERRLLKAEADTAALVIRRLGTAKGRSVEFRRTLVRGDRFELHSDFAGQDGYHLDLLRSPHPKQCR
ncbi:GntR family transcriptional regulator [Amycolatopsis thailandensis]|uniref:GntR family transcriptional regulator n=1 Tax=Amycolatopsis thailandensis TaxID=589330 RepID=UPI0036320387